MKLQIFWWEKETSESQKTVLTGTAIHACISAVYTLCTAKFLYAWNFWLTFYIFQIMQYSMRAHCENTVSHNAIRSTWPSLTWKQCNLFSFLFFLINDIFLLKIELKSQNNSFIYNWTPLLAWKMPYNTVMWQQWNFSMLHSLLFYMLLKIKIVSKWKNSRQWLCSKYNTSILLATAYY